jgi:hypothetical protein
MLALRADYGLWTMAGLSNSSSTANFQDCTTAAAIAEVDGNVTILTAGYTARGIEAGTPLGINVKEYFTIVNNDYAIVEYPLQPASLGGGDAFVLLLAAETGAPIWFALLGGADGSDEALAAALDGASGDGESFF